MALTEVSQRNTPRKRVSENSRHLSPWQILRILYRISQGEQVRDLCAYHNLAPSTVFRWNKAWGHESHHGRADSIAVDIAGARRAVAELKAQAELILSSIGALEVRLADKRLGSRPIKKGSP